VNERARRRRLLILCYFYPPLAGGGVHRVLSFTRHLPAFGWDTTVVCAGPEDYWVTDDSLVERIPRDTEVIRAAGGSALAAWLRVRRADRGRRSSRVFGALRRASDWWLLPDSYVGWARRARAAADRRLARGDIDVLLSTSPPDSAHRAARPLAARHGVPWVADFRDPWVGLAFREPPTAWHRARQQAMERDVLAHADLVLAASRTHAEWLAARPDPPRAIEHLPNGFEPGARADTAALDVGAAPASFRIVFTGTLSQMPDTGVFLEALHELFARRPEARRVIRATLAGPHDADYADRAVALGLTGIVSFPGPLAHQEVRALQRGADLLLLWKPRGYPTMVPGKLYEYLDSARPLVAVLPAADEAAELAVRGGARRIDPGDRAALAAAIEETWEAWRARGRAPDRRAEWIDGHARAAIAGRLAARLDGLVAGRPS
jgi:glycosyltransferase involved in cell wall biosynthesis